MGVSIFNTWFTYLRNSFNHDHIKKKSLKGTFSFYLFELFKWIHFSLYRYWKFIIWLIIANYCFFYFSRIGDYVLNWSNTSFPCWMSMEPELTMVCGRLFHSLMVLGKEYWYASTLVEGCRYRMLCPLVPDLDGMR